MNAKLICYHKMQKFARVARRIFKKVKGWYSLKCKLSDEKNFLLDSCTLYHLFKESIPMILGAIVGDVVGSRYEFNNIKSKKFKLVTSACSFTDDTVMTLAVASALRKWKKGEPIKEKDFAKAVIEEMKSFGKKYPNAGYAARFRNWLFGRSSKPYGSFGNGSAMRVSPIAWYFDDLETVEKFAGISAEVTHNHPQGIKGAQATAAAIFLARKGKSKAAIRGYIEAKYDYDLSRTCDEIRPVYTFDGSCLGTVPEAIVAFLDADNFEDALRNAVSLGGDTDTLAAITCSIAQGLWEIPEEIEKSVRGKLDDFLNAELDQWELALAEQEQEQEQGKTSNGITEMVFILDRSGSMSGLESDTIGGFNSMIEKQKNEGGEAYVSTILFDDVQEVLHNRVKLSEIKPMTEKEYFTRGSTALLDAVGRAIHHTTAVHNNTAFEDIPEHTIFVIITDGYENASRQYSYEKVKSMIEHKKEKRGWEFLFVGANVDAVQAASNIGISARRAVNYVADAKGTEAVYEGVSEAMCCMSRSIEPDFELDDSWREEIDEDFRRRSRR